MPSVASSRLAWPGTTWSNAMAMSAPSAHWISMEDSAVSRRTEPSRWLVNSTPSSEMVRSPLSENTWKPPESVSIGRGQVEKRCSPPRARTVSSPGRRCR